jgi:primosomal replication protein PriB
LRNEIVFAGTVVKCDVLRHTPAGIPSIKFSVNHESKQAIQLNNATVQIPVTVEIEIIALDDLAQQMVETQPGVQVTVKGFLNRKHQKSSVNILHATQIKFS